MNELLDLFGCDITHLDAHIHTPWIKNFDNFLDEAEELGLITFGMSVSPSEYNFFCRNLIDTKNFSQGLGLHPFFATENEVEQFCEEANNTSLIGEIGLDFRVFDNARRSEYSKKMGSGFVLPNKEEQKEYFETICNSIAPGSCLSVHSIHAMPYTYEILKKSGRLSDCICIFHMYGEDSDTLSKLRKAGCYFSVSMKMLNTKKGREYVRQIDIDKILLETDAPDRPNSSVCAKDIAETLADTYKKICEVKGI